MSLTKTVKVSRRFQIAVPALARNLLNIQSGDLLIVDVQDGMLILLPKPENYTQKLAGLHKEIWEGIDAGDYVDQERRGVEILTSLASFSLIGIDTPIFIYHLEGHPTYLPITQTLFSSIEAGEKKGITSTITLMEIAVRPLQLGRPEIAVKYEALLANFPNFSLVDINQDIARRAAQLRAEYRLRPADALQVAACQVHAAKVFITNDRRLAVLKPEIEIIVLDDFIAK